MAGKRKVFAPAEADGAAEAALGDYTARTLARRGRVLYARICGSAAVVIALDAAMTHFFDNGFPAYVLLALMAVAFVSFVVAVLSFAAFWRMRWVLQHNPWVEWYARTGAAHVFGRDAVRVVVLAHPEWAGEVVRTVHPFRYARQLPAGQSLTVWAAGHPDGGMVVSLMGGDSPLTAVRWPLASLKRRLTSTVDGDSNAA